ncbi:hypothetical protein FRAHR75_60077 [Frankia sp. Hr75.2]|nr:hypothetical protein FRAHR75_60077 [Frankia sp. Hr75.2]SQD95595.1 hypothetical protein FMEAI12_3250001 [Parafrankia sp. Ea1.12]
MRAPAARAASRGGRRADTGLTRHVPPPGWAVRRAPAPSGPGRGSALACAGTGGHGRHL